MPTDQIEELDDNDRRPILAVRVPPDIKKTFDQLAKVTGKKFQQSAFVNQAIVEKLEKDYPLEFLRKMGYIRPDY